MKLLNGSELAGYIKERQAKQVRSLRQSAHIQPRLAIVLTVDHPAINVYVKMKKVYGADILVDVDIHRIKQDQAPAVIKQLNEDPSIHGIIVQLPLEDPSQTEEIVNLVAPEKDVDALGEQSKFEPATPMAIMWLLSGYNISLIGKQVLLVGRGKLVGAPLEKILKASGVSVTMAEKDDDLSTMAKHADVIIAAANQSGILTADMIKQDTVVVDAGVASEDGKTLGNVSPEVYERQDLTITPAKGGVGPLTVCALFENVIRAAGGLYEKS